MTVMVGRGAELEAILSFVTVDTDTLLLSLEGEAGIGKTTLWRAAIGEVSETGSVVCASRPSEAETSFSFATVTDLLSELSDELLNTLPGPQRRALEVAALRRDEGEEPFELHAVAAGFLSAVRALVGDARLLIAIDDVQWVDAASAAVLEFALRRIGLEEGVRFLFSRRDRGASVMDLTRSVPPERVRQIELGPLSLGAVQHLVWSRLGWRLSRPLARRIHEASGGNPLYALEVAAALYRRGGQIDPSKDLPVPDTLMALLASRLDEIEPEVERVLLAVALGSNPREEAIRSMFADEVVRRAVAADLLVRDRDRVHLAHPLFGSVVRARATSEMRCDLHMRLANIAVDREERARHLGLACNPPDELVALELETASDAAAARGASVAAAELAELAWRFTDATDRGLRADRLLVLADRHARAGFVDRGIQLLEPELASLEVGPVRARALLLLSRLQRAEPSAEMLDEALAEADDRARAEILAEKAFTAALGDASQVSDAREWAAEAVALAQASGNSTLMASCVTTFAWMEALAGNDIEPLLDTLERNVTDKLAGYDNPDRLRAVRAVWRGEVDRARELLVSLVARAREREEDWSEAVFVLHRFELEQRVGDWVEAERVLDEFRLAAASHPAAATTAIHRCRAFVAAARGDLGVVMTTTDAVRDPELEASGWQRLEAIRARGFAALVAGDPASAVTDLAAVADAVEAGGVCDPGAFPYGGDLIEALVAAGRLTDARAVLQRFETVCSEQSHPWGLAIAARCRGIVLAQEGDERAAVCSFNEAIERQSRLGLLFDLARSQLGLGTLYRRSRRIADARALLDSAAVMFDQLGSPPLAARARDEIARLGGHRRGVGLTATEERVADLVAQGLTNKEIATTLFVTVNTVEAHLTRTYTKLGIHSRSELVRRRLLREPGRGSKGS